MDQKPFREPHRKKLPLDCVQGFGPLTVKVLGEKQPYKKLDQKRRTKSITDVKLYIYIKRVNLLVFQNTLFPVFKVDNEI